MAVATVVLEVCIKRFSGSHVNKSVVCVNSVVITRVKSVFNRKTER